MIEQAPRPWPRLGRGDTVAVVAPADWLDPDILERGAAELEKLGLDVMVDPQCREKWGRLAGPDEVRAAALDRAFRDPSIRAVWCARGGYGSARLVDRVDWAALARDPKPIIGYSDVTTLLSAALTLAGVGGIHGPIVKDFATGAAPLGRRAVLDLLGVAEDPDATSALLATARPLVDGVAEGPLVGGNLCHISAMLGTSIQPPLDGAILLIEEVDEALYVCDRLFHHLSLAGVFKAVSGVLVGDFTAISREEEVPGGLETLLEHHLGRLGIPVAVDVPCGHGVERMPFEIGARARLEVGGGRVAFGAVDPMSHSPISTAI